MVNISQQYMLFFYEGSSSNINKANKILNSQQNIYPFKILFYIGVNGFDSNNILYLILKF